MKLWLDVQALQGPFFERGIARYVRGLATALDEQGTDIAGFGLNPSQPPPNEIHAAVGRSPHAKLATAANLRDAASSSDLVYLSGSAFEGYLPIQNLWPNYLVIPDVPAAAIVYDTIPFRRLAEFQATHERRRFYASRRHLLERADCYLAISNSTAVELRQDLDVGSKPVHVVGCGVDERFIPPADLERAIAVVTASFPELRSSFLFYVGGFQPQKNVEGLITAYSLLPHGVRDGIQLVIGGSVPADRTMAWRKQAEQLGVAASVLFTGMVADSTLLALYQTARLAVVPSKHEGFGLPAAEAIACGTPAITSNTSSLPEVVGWKPATFDPDDPSDIASKIEQVLTDQVFDISLRAACATAAKRHSWPTVATRVAGFIAPLTDLGRGPATSPRVAVIDDPTLGSSRPRWRRPPDRPESTRFDLFGDPERSLRHGSIPFPFSSFGRTVETTLYDSVVNAAGRE